MVAMGVYILYIVYILTVVYTLYIVPPPPPKKKKTITTPNDEGLPDKWGTTESIKSVCLIQARTGNVRTYIVGKAQLKEMTVLVC